MHCEMYEFQRPSNFDAIKCSIVRRVRERREGQAHANLCKPIERPPPCADNGLPSPPVETLPFEEAQKDCHEKFELDRPEMAADALLVLSAGLTPPSGPYENTPASATEETTRQENAASTRSDAMSCSDVDRLDDNEIRARIQALQQEKHHLFQVMKSLLAQQQDNDTVMTTSEHQSPEKPRHGSEARDHPMPLATEPQPAKHPRSRSRDRSVDRSVDRTRDHSNDRSSDRNREMGARKSRPPRLHSSFDFRASHYSPYRAVPRGPPSPPRFYGRDRPLLHVQPHAKHPFSHPAASEMPLFYSPRRMSRPYPFPRPMVGITGAPPFRSQRPFPSRHLARH